MLRLVRSEEGLLCWAVGALEWFPFNLGLFEFEVEVLFR